MAVADYILRKIVAMDIENANTLDSRPNGSLELSMAPLQGYTTAEYRQAHHTVFGGNTTYYAPFLRLEGGKPDKRAMRDIMPENNQGLMLVPQVICCDVREFEILVENVLALGYGRIDINMGCPFVLQTKRGRGAGLLAHPEKLEQIVGLMSQIKQCRFSVKMRLGLDKVSQGLRAIEILNRCNLQHVTVHPRLATHQYKGQPDMQSFEQMMRASANRIVYNGDVVTDLQIVELAERFQLLKGIMVGRGLLMRPWMLSQFYGGEIETDLRLLELHDVYRRLIAVRLAGAVQLLQHLKAFWQYPSANLSDKTAKCIRKSTSIARYDAIISGLRNARLHPNLL